MLGAYNCFSPDIDGEQNALWLQMDIGQWLVRVPNLYFGSIQYSWGTWLDNDMLHSQNTKGLLPNYISALHEIDHGEI